MKWRRISRATKLPSRFFKILKITKNFQNFQHFFLFQNFFPPQNQNFQKTVQYVRGKWLMNMCTKFQVDIFKNGWDMAWNMSKTGTFHVISGLNRDFPNFFFFADLDVSKSVLGSFFAFFAKIWPKNMYRTSKSRNFLFDLFLTWWPQMTLTSIMVTKHSKWYLQMSETLSMPISWLCLCLTSQFCSPMSPSPKCRTFWLWPDLWRHSWPRGQ